MWTATKPTKPGRYAWRPDKAPWRTVEQQIELLELVEHRGKLVIERSCADIDPRRGEWWDAPIVLPWEAQPEPVSAELLAAAKKVMADLNHRISKAQPVPRSRSCCTLAVTDEAHGVTNDDRC